MNEPRLCRGNGKNRAVIVGSDVPGITPDIIKEVFRNLTDNDFTIGGTDDGEYYLLGMNTYDPVVFRDIEWSTPAVFLKTLNAIVNRGKICWQLPVLSDIDFEEDWREYGWEMKDKQGNVTQVVTSAKTGCTDLT